MVIFLNVRVSKNFAFQPSRLPSDNVRINSLDTLKSKNVAIQDLSGRPFLKVIYGGGIPTFIVGIPHFSGLILYSRDRVDTVYQDLRVGEKPKLQQGRDGKSRVFKRRWPWCRRI